MVPFCDCLFSIHYPSRRQVFRRQLRHKAYSVITVNDLKRSALARGDRLVEVVSA